MRIRAALLLVVVASCKDGRPVPRAEMPGRYAVKQGAVHDTLDVRADGSFDHRLWDASGLAISETGTWMSSVLDGEPIVELTGISPVAGRRGPHVARPGFWPAHTGRDRRGRVTLLLNEDLNLYYTQLAGDTH